jgi:hypothetical protein
MKIHKIWPPIGREGWNIQKRITHRFSVLEILLVNSKAFSVMWLTLIPPGKVSVDLWIWRKITGQHLYLKIPIYFTNVFLNLK